jgi:hypothetical protein
MTFAPRLATGIALLVALFLLALAAAPERAAAQSVCLPNGDGTYTPTPGPGPGPPGSIEIGPGEACPATTPVEPEPPPAELPAEPECPNCPDEAKKEARSATATDTASGGPVSDTSVAAPEQLPFTGLDSVRAALLLGGLGFVAIGFGFAIRRRTSHDW